MTLRDVIEEASNNSREYVDFFPKDRIETAEGRFELLCLSVLDVYRYNSDKLWYQVAPYLRKRNILSITYLTESDNNQIIQELKNAGYERGSYTAEFAHRLKRLTNQIKISPFNGDVSNLFNGFQEHNQETIRSILKSLRQLSGIGQKVATMFLKFMISDFQVWVWMGDENSLINLAPPIDSQVKKVYIRLGNQVTGNFENDLQNLSQQINLSFIKIDDVLWNVGRIFCKSKISPSCEWHCRAFSALSAQTFKQSLMRRL